MEALRLSAASCAALLVTITNAKASTLHLAPCIFTLGQCKKALCQFSAASPFFTIICCFLMFKFLTIYYKIWYNGRGSIKEKTVLSDTSLLLVFLSLLWLNINRDIFWNLNVKCTKAVIFKTIFFLKLVPCINLFLKAFYLIYMAIFSQHEFRWELLSFCSLLINVTMCYKYIKDIRMF